MSQNPKPHTMMPEVLPETTRFDPRQSPRERVRIHLRRFAGASTGVLAATQLCYCVVDMLPAPVECSSTDAPPPRDVAHADATFSADEDGLLMNITFWSYGVAGMSWGDDDTVEVENATLIEITRGEDDAPLLTLHIDSETTRVVVTVVATCAEEERLSFEFNVKNVGTFDTVQGVLF